MQSIKKALTEGNLEMKNLGIQKGTLEQASPSEYKRQKALKTW